MSGLIHRFYVGQEDTGQAPEKAFAIAGRGARYLPRAESKNSTTGFENRGDREPCIRSPRKGTRKYTRAPAVRLRPARSRRAGHRGAHRPGPGGAGLLARTPSDAPRRREPYQTGPAPPPSSRPTSWRESTWVPDDVRERFGDVSGRLYQKPDVKRIVSKIAVHADPPAFSRVSVPGPRVSSPTLPPLRRLILGGHGVTASKLGYGT